MRSALSLSSIAVLSLFLQACGGGGSSPSQPPSSPPPPPPPPPPPANTAPAVTAGTAVVTETSFVSVTVQASDGQNDPLTYDWTQTSGVAVSFIEDGASIRFLSPSVSQDETLVFDVDVSDGSLSSSAAVTVTIENAPSTFPDATPATVLLPTVRTATPAMSHDNTPGNVWLDFNSALPGASIGDAHGYIDLDGDGTDDLITYSGLATFEGDVYLARAFLLDPATGTWTEDASLWNGAPPALEHARKLLIDDYNGDGEPDIFVIGHGYDAPPFAGENLHYALSSSGQLTAEEITLTGFWHGGGSGDIDDDGDSDVAVVTGGNTIQLLLNDGTGQFVVGSTITLPSFGYYTLDLVDVDMDGCIDMLAGGHEFEGATSRLLTGDCSGSFVIGSAFPEYPTRGIILDFDPVDLDGDGTNEIVINRVGDPTGDGFYVGSVVEVVTPDGSGAYQSLGIIASTTNTWSAWIRAQDIDDDGDVDVFSDDKSFGVSWQNNLDPVQ